VSGLLTRDGWLENRITGRELNDRPVGGNAILDFADRFALLRLTVHAARITVARGSSSIALV
jgi:hypothetical protein